MIIFQTTTIQSKSTTAFVLLFLYQGNFVCSCLFSPGPAECKYPLLCIDIHGYPDDIKGCPWISQDIHGTPWSKDVHGNPLNRLGGQGYLKNKTKSTCSRESTNRPDLKTGTASHIIYICEHLDFLSYLGEEGGRGEDKLKSTCSKEATRRHRDMKTLGGDRNAEHKTLRNPKLALGLRLACGFVPLVSGTRWTLAAGTSVSFQIWANFVPCVFHHVFKNQPVGNWKN